MECLNELKTAHILAFDLTLILFHIRSYSRKDEHIVYNDKNKQKNQKSSNENAEI